MSKKDELLSLKLQKLKALEREKEERELLPHLHMHKFYPWSRELFDDWENRTQVLVAANQLGKSSSIIKKLIDLAISPDKWKELWPDLPPGTKPAQWWYLYPTKENATVEYHEKWVPLLPKVSKDHPQLGWKHDIRNRFIWSINFNSGINIYFKTYAQDVQHLQSGSVYILTGDEEMPVELLPELQTRTNATDGFMFFVFTATLGQKFWKEVVESRTQWPHAKVRQVSLMDCEYYEDGTPSIWTPERIQKAIDKCTSRAEVQRRIFGKFVVDEGLKYQSFDRERHMRPYHPVPKTWTNYAGIDYGSGGEKGHPSAITVLAVNPEKTKIRVIRHWRGDFIQTTAQYVVNKYIEITKGIAIETAWYDYSARDLKTITERVGLPIQPAEKRVDIGEGTLNSLLKLNDAFCIYQYNEMAQAVDIPEEWMQGYKIAEEMEFLSEKIDKRHAKDDSIDSLRYAVAKLDMDWDALSPFDAPAKVEEIKTQSQLRRESVVGIQEKEFSEIDIGEEIEFWQEQLEN